MIREESKIAFTNDIIKEAAKELDMSTEKVQEVYTAMMTYLKYLTDETDAVAIFIPHIGTLHLKLWYLFDRLKQYRKNPEKLSIYRQKKKNIDVHLQEHIDKSYTGKSRHLERNKIDRMLYNGGKNLPEIEKIQNSK